MTGQPVCLSLAPLSPGLGPRSITFLSSDRFRLLLGGSRSDSQREASPIPILSPFCFDEHTVDAGQATIRCEHGQAQLIQHGRDNTTLLNGRPLVTDERVHFHHGDTIELGYYDWMVGTCIVTLRLRIHLSSSPFPPASVQDSGRDSAELLSANVTSSFLQHIHELQESFQRLSQDLALAQTELRDARATAAAHICIPPRPYGALLADLRAGAYDDEDPIVTSTIVASSTSDALCSSPVRSATIRSASFAKSSCPAPTESVSYLGTDLGTKVMQTPICPSSCSAPKTLRSSDDAVRQADHGEAAVCRSQSATYDTAQGSSDEAVIPLGSTCSPGCATSDAFAVRVPDSRANIGVATSVPTSVLTTGTPDSITASASGSSTDPRTSASASAGDSCRRTRTRRTRRRAPHDQGKAHVASAAVAANRVGAAWCNARRELLFASVSADADLLSSSHSSISKQRASSESLLRPSLHAYASCDPALRTPSSIPESVTPFRTSLPSNVTGVAVPPLVPAATDTYHLSPPSLNAPMAHSIPACAAPHLPPPAQPVLPPPQQLCTTLFRYHLCSPLFPTYHHAQLLEHPHSSYFPALPLRGCC
ncbi:hypothetical protein CF319_g8733 [Tilletia indica]|nr:hypothetical protein CF319_g8733 [Tilletia indica]